MKIGIITLIGNCNCGNRLQNYAVQYYLKHNEVVTINNNSSYILEVLKRLKGLKVYIDPKNERERYKKFILFNKRINFSKKVYFSNSNLSDLNKFDFLVVGSDQVWNPTFGRLKDLELLSFADNNKRIAFSASFGIDNIPENMKLKVGEELKKFKAISVREDRGKEIVEELTGRKDVEVLVDPTMLLRVDEWDKVSKKPKMLKSKKYILNYFLGDLSYDRKKEIERVAKENDCDIINMLDRNSQFYACGPSEFLYLEKNAFLICTDSFHSCVFAILYNRPFIVFDREDKNMANMNSRIETLMNKFNLKNRIFTGKITEDNLIHNYDDVYKILEKERIKAEKFIKKALNTK